MRKGEGWGGGFRDIKHVFYFLTPFFFSNLALSHFLLEKPLPKNTPRVFHVETTWKRPFPRRFNVEYMWCVCRAIA